MAKSKSAESVLAMFKDKDVKYVDLRFTDPRGKLQHLTMDVSLINEDAFADGIMFDGSSIAGWKAINESDMTLMPDPDSVHTDPFYAQTTAVLFCDILDPGTGEAYDRDPRMTAKKAEAFLKQSKIGETVYVGPEAEFFIFDDVRFTSEPYNTGFRIDSVELPTNAGTEYEMGNQGHRMRTKGGYFPVNPMDSAQDMRSEMLSVMAEMGVVVEKHHHEVAAAQHELGMKFASLVRMADHMQIYKYVIHNVAHAYGKTATFMPKPVMGDNGSGMHCHFSIWNEGRPLFAGNQYADLSETCLYFIGGVIKHAKSLQRLHQSLDQFLQAAGPRLRGAGAARLFLAQPVGIVPHPLHHQPQGEAGRGAVPRSLGQSLSRLLGDLDGRARRHPQQDPSRRSDRQEPLRPAAGRAQGDPDGVRLAEGGADHARP